MMAKNYQAHSMHNDFTTMPCKEMRWQERGTERWESNDRQRMRRRSGRQLGGCLKKRT